ncbi:hypothetical protein GBAR_LOCUS11262 [Geodia barretti]|uniref:Uncharacterized protein n=2 Tax=Geodia barretti TaxID=519541 RepID=A0AA35RWK7_GEOBA|nr:hypothetical protein GBAR_LOCUS11262 [Geodia barretti]
MANNDSAPKFPCFGSSLVQGHTHRCANLYNGGRFECHDKPHQLCHACANYTNCYMEGHNNGKAVPEQEEDLDTVDDPVENIQDLN